jgi:hypothetical protein
VGASTPIVNASDYQYWAQVGAASVSRTRFDNIGWSLLAVFQILTLENWNDLMVGVGLWGPLGLLRLACPG